ncbi:MAG: DUF559 domain-containing protein [Microcoleaceae cyanobacterium MO_207.B10]|nr:DUF559 domain-containing protein [Microcoleaceae cyanobacterium MO_207.B10]
MTDLELVWQKIIDKLELPATKLLFQQCAKLIDLDFDKKRAIIFVEKYSLKMIESRYSRLEKAVYKVLGEDFKPILTDNQILPYKNHYTDNQSLFCKNPFDEDLDSDSSDSVSLTVEDFQERKLKIIRQIELSNNTKNLEPLNNCRFKDDPIKWKNLNFRSQSEVKIAEELDKRGICFFPNSALRLTTKKGRENKEPDFFVLYNKKYAILEVDGISHTPERRVEEQERERDFERNGMRIFRFDSNKCYNNPSNVVDEFLELLNNI